MAQLREGRSRDHLPQIVPARVGSDGGRKPRVTQVDRCARAFDCFRESHIVDHGIADCCNGPKTNQGLTAGGGGAARGGGGGGAGGGRAGEGGERREEGGEG